MHKIISIEEIGEIDTIDIQVSGNNLFYANDILTHNSAIVAAREEKSLGQDHIQGGISKINTSDLVIALVKDEAMEIAGEYRFEFLKARNSNAVNKKLTMGWNHDSLLITDAGLKLTPPTMKVTRRTMNSVNPGSNEGGLADLLAGR